MESAVFKFLRFQAVGNRRPRERASPGVHRATQRDGLRYAM
jgi:hypothetical protein